MLMKSLSKVLHTFWFSLDLTCFKIQSELGSLSSDNMTEGSERHFAKRDQRLRGAAHTFLIVIYRVHRSTNVEGFKSKGNHENDEINAISYRSGLRGKNSPGKGGEERWRRAHPHSPIKNT